MYIILDTDIGSNIDDSFALLYLLKKCPERLLAVSTNSVRANQRANLVRTIIDQQHPDIPVYAGAESSLDGEVMGRDPVLIPNVNKGRVNKTVPDQPWRHYQKLIENYPGEIDLITIGPLTNIAGFITRFPHSAAKLKSIRIMGGKYGPAPAYHKTHETNVVSDPAAFKTVIDKALCPLYMTGIDITINAKIDEFSQTMRRMLPEWLEKQLLLFKQTGRPLILHDVVVTASLFTEILAYENGDVEVSTTSGPDCGKTRFVANKKNTKRFIAKSIDIDKFWNEFRNTIMG